MKKLNNLNLHQLEKTEMTKKEMNAIKGGYELPDIYVCVCKCICPNADCGCHYAGNQEGYDDEYYGASDTDANFAAYQSSLRASNTSSASGDSGV